MTLVEGTTGEKRSASSPLDKIKVKKCKGTPENDINQILERTTIKKEINKLRKFRFETIREFLEHNGVEFDAADVVGLLKELLGKGMLKYEVCFTKEDGSCTDMLSDEIEVYKAAKLEEAFEMKLKMEETTPIALDATDLGDSAKLKENLSMVIEKLNEVQVGTSEDLKKLREKAKATETERVVRSLMDSKLEILVSGLNMQGNQAKNGFELGLFCRKNLRDQLTLFYQDDMSKQVETIKSISDNEGHAILTLFDNAEVRALGKTPKITQGTLTLPVMVKAGSSRGRDRLKEALFNLPGIRARDSIPKGFQSQRAAVQGAVKSVKRYFPETYWVRADVASVGHGLTPTFKVQTKNSIDKGSKWETIGSVPIRDPAVWGQIPEDTVRESILVALGLMEE